MAQTFKGWIGTDLAEHGMAWRQILDGAPIARSIGIGGEATTFLLDANGRIIGRNLANGDLSEAVGGALGAVRQ